MGRVGAKVKQLPFYLCNGLPTKARAITPYLTSFLCSKNSLNLLVCMAIESWELHARNSSIVQELVYLKKSDKGKTAMVW
jgi:hypothetical protein